MDQLKSRLKASRVNSRDHGAHSGQTKSSNLKVPHARDSLDYWLGENGRLRAVLYRPIESGFVPQFMDCKHSSKVRI